jgi:hypothetical protein
MKALHNVQFLSMCISTAQVWLLYEKEKCHWSVFCFLLFFLFWILPWFLTVCISTYFRCKAIMMLFRPFIIWPTCALTVSIIVGIS